jgi:hypothetical protein
MSPLQYLIEVNFSGKTSNQLNSLALNFFHKNYFNDNYEINIFFNDPKLIFEDKSNYIFILLIGKIYKINNPFRYIIENYIQKENLKFCKELNGSYNIFLFDLKKSKFFVLTDRYSSIKTFYSKINNKHIFSNQIKFHNKFHKDLDLIGLGWYLSSGVVYNNRTLIKGVHTLDRASLINIKKDILVKEKYWDLYFTNELDNVNIKELIKIFSELLIYSVKERISLTGNNYISLSGGYDASAILGIFNLLNINPQCFIYDFNKYVIKGTDAYVAILQAQKYNYNFIIYQIDNLNFINSIIKNAQYGQGISNYCEEINAWEYFSENNKQYDDISIFFGDECFGLRDIYFTSKYEALKYLKIYNTNSILSLMPIIGHEIFTFIDNGMEDDINNIFKNVPLEYNNYDIYNYLYLDQRVNHALLNWRNFFAGRISQPVMPFLDYELVDFICKLPQNYRKNKMLFKTTIQKLLPDLFNIKRSSIKYDNDYLWANILKTNKNDIIKVLKETSSSLFCYFEPEIIISLLDNNYNKNKFTKYFVKIHKLLPLIKSNLLKEFLYKITNKPYYVDNFTLVKRFLTIHFFLINYFKNE